MLGKSGVRVVLVAASVGLASLLVAGSTAAYGPEAAVVRGGLLYDKWFKVLRLPAPAAANPAYPESGAARGKDGADWRCKECHGWDYKGRDGAYGPGREHFTGIKGIRAMAGADLARVAAAIRDGNHSHTAKLLSDQDVHDLAMFVAKGQIDVDKYIDRNTKAAKGRPGDGAKYYETMCANCHGFDGKRTAEVLGLDAKDNPWEYLHKIRIGHPGEPMPPMMVFDPQIAADILAHLQTLPDK